MGIVVSEGKHRYFGIGASYSSVDGGGIEGYWGHRNLFGQAESLRIEGAVRGLGELDAYLRERGIELDGMTVDGAAILCGNIPTANATVYVIDTVLMP